MTDFEKQCYEKYPVYLQGLNPEQDAHVDRQPGLLLYRMAGQGKVRNDNRVRWSCDSRTR